MRTLEIIPEDNLFTATRLNWETCASLYAGSVPETFRVYSLDPLSFLIVTLALHPEWLRGAKTLVWAWYGRGMGFGTDAEMEAFAGQFRRFVAPFPDASKRGVALWESRLRTLEGETLPKLEQSIWRQDLLTREVPYPLSWCLRETSQGVFLWKRSEGVKNPLLTNILREIQEVHGILPLWMERVQDAFPHEGLFIQIPSSYLTHYKETCDVGSVSQYGGFP